jgi:hypothetical protein
MSKKKELKKSNSKAPELTIEQKTENLLLEIETSGVFTDDEKTDFNALVELRDNGIKFQIAYLLICGKSKTAISEFMKISRGKLYRVMNTVEFWDFYRMLSETHKQETVSRIQRLADKATDVLEKSLESENDIVKLRATMYILDKITKPDENPFVKEMTKQMLKGLDGYDKNLQRFISKEQLSTAQRFDLYNVTDEEIYDITEQNRAK